MAGITGMVTVFTVVSVLASAKALRHQAAAKARGLTTRGADVEQGQQWLLVAVLAMVMGGSMVLIGWQYSVTQINPPFWLKAGSLAVNATVVLGGIQFSLWRRRAILDPKPPEDDNDNTVPPGTASL